MNRNDQEALVAKFLDSNTLAVLATVGSGKQPEAAAVYITPRFNFQLIFHTFGTYRKYKNLQTNSNIALVIGWDEERTLQYEGTVEEPKGSDLMDCVELHQKRHERLPQFDGEGVIKYFLVTPRWIRFTDLSHNPWLSFELNFPA